MARRPGRVHGWVPRAAGCISCEAAGSPPALGVGKLRQAQGQRSRLAGSAQCPGKGAEPVAGRGGPAAPLTRPTSPCSSRTKNMMWYGVLGTKELLQRTYKNLEQRVQLEVRGRGEQGWGRGAGGAASPPGSALSCSAMACPSRCPACRASLSSTSPATPGASTSGEAPRRTT